MTLRRFAHKNSPAEQLTASHDARHSPANESADAYEREAERVSEHVMNMRSPQPRGSCACGGGCPGCRAGTASDNKHLRLPVRTHREQAAWLKPPRRR